MRNMVKSTTSHVSGSYFINIYGDSSNSSFSFWYKYIWIKRTLYSSKLLSTIWLAVFKVNIVESKTENTPIYTVKPMTMNAQEDIGEHAGKSVCSMRHEIENHGCLKPKQKNKNKNKNCCTSEFMRVAAVRQKTFCLHLILPFF